VIPVITPRLYVNLGEEWGAFGDRRGKPQIRGGSVGVPSKKWQVSGGGWDPKRAACT